MSCPLRRFDDVKMQTPSRPTNTAAVKELSNKLATMKLEREKQDQMWLDSVPETSVFSSLSNRGTNVRKVDSNESR